ncbi:hypothetical protein KQX54_003078 [Cotesia glomerata]|uniref:Uncharacterized protein n=1 Tax=Cotesia glomerata TaxID=32391 RepID=A0AAV7IPA6_COTGL|nr:hypothetical protein KQX54_003078 [Cotesia glomerata]
MVLVRRPSGGWLMRVWVGGVKRLWVRARVSWKLGTRARMWEYPTAEQLGAQLGLKLGLGWVVGGEHHMQPSSSASRGVRHPSPVTRHPSPIHPPTPVTATPNSLESSKIENPSVHQPCLTTSYPLSLCL